MLAPKAASDFGNWSTAVYANCTGSSVNFVIRDAAALAYDDPPS